VCCWSVGLVQRELEAAGFTTICLTPVPDLTASLSVPRIAAIEYPLGRTLGQPCDAAGQTAVLEAVLGALESIHTPGEIVHLPFEWPEDPRDVQKNHHADPPIGRYLARHPWLLPKLLSRDVPG
jgi:D-proline reductase (dithiol) PrdB